MCSSDNDAEKEVSVSFHQDAGVKPLPDGQDGQRDGANARARPGIANKTLIDKWLKLPILLLWWPYRSMILFLMCIAVLRVSIEDDNCGAAPFEEAFFGDNFLAKLRQSFRETMVCGKHTRGFHLKENERIIMLLFSLLVLLSDIIPKYLKEEEAKRHIIQPKAKRILLIHILSGSVSFIGFGLVGITMAGSPPDHNGFIFWFLCSADFIHQMSIIVMLKNHDGIYPCRLGNAVIGVFKFVTMVNHKHLPGMEFYDTIFATTFGFVGTRLGGVLSYVASLLLREDAVKSEAWYSIGLSVAQFVLMIRVPGQELHYLFLAPLISRLFYHELWRRSEKPMFVLFNVAFTAFCVQFLTAPPARYFALAVYYVVAGFNRPWFHRCPELALATDKSKKKKKSAYISYETIKPAGAYAKRPTAERMKSRKIMSRANSFMN